MKKKAGKRGKRLKVKDLPASKSGKRVKGGAIAAVINPCTRTRRGVINPCWRAPSTGGTVPCI
jgi:hypothetical protein